MIHKTIDFSRYTSIGIGGTGELFEPQSLFELAEWVKENNDFYVIGSGTNILVSDEGPGKPVISLHNFQDIMEFGVNGEVIVEAGCKVSEFGKILCNRGYTGLEWSCFLPGTIGGAVVGNSAIYRDHPISEFLSWIEIINQDGILGVISDEKLNFKRRWSSLIDMNCIVTKAAFKLRQDNKDKINKRFTDTRKIKYNQVKKWNGKAFGNFFRDIDILRQNVDKIKTWEIDTLYMPKELIGWIVNKGNATARAVIQFAQQIEREIGQKLEWEVQLMGKF